MDNSVEVKMEKVKIDPRDIFFTRINGFIRPICLYDGQIASRCPNNDDGLCSTKLLDYPRESYHDWDGKNCWKCPCG